MDNWDYSHFGRKLSKHIGRMVRDGMRTGNLGQVGRDMADGAQDIANSVKQAVHTTMNDGQLFHQPMPNISTGDFGRIRPQARMPMFRKRMPGRISGIICSILGFFTGIPLLLSDFGVFMVRSTVSTANFLITTVVLTVFTAIALVVAGVGVALRHRARRFSRYRSALGGAAFGSITEIAAASGQTPERTKKDLQKMIKTGACPQGHFDSTGEWFIVDDETYEEYLEAQKSYEERQAVERAEEEKKRKDPKLAELEAVEKEGKEYLCEIRAANDALPGEEISKKLDRLEDVTNRIFQCVEEHPEKLPEIRRFLRYYMPTTLKLVKSYQEFESQPVHGENITKAEGEIESALDTINAAFANLLDTLYADDVLDVSTDISTLKTMLKQEGLTGSDFVKQPEQNDAAPKSKQD